MRNPFGVNTEEKKYWIPVLLGIGTSIALFGVANLTATLKPELVHNATIITSWITILIGLGMVGLGGTWSSQSSITNINKVKHRSFLYQGFTLEATPDRKAPFFMGEDIGFSVKIKNITDQPKSKKFFFIVKLPDGMLVRRFKEIINFGPNEERYIRLDPPIFLGFLGIFMLTLVVGRCEERYATGDFSGSITGFETLFSGYSRDHDGFTLQRKIAFLTRVLVALTIILVVLTGVLIFRE